MSEINLGNDNTTKNAKVAVRDFLRREFPEIFERTSTPHDVIFMPDSFIYKEHTEMVILKNNEITWDGVD
jgi:hypothetical protein